MEAKRKHVLENIGNKHFPNFIRRVLKGKDVVQQIYNYMEGNKLRYESESSPVLKAYAYLTRQVKENPKSPKPQVVVPV
ncbi:uncharacterized protein OCT59_022906 [Rhizophagus irregularis]|uniref:uncharacterized protein n=1 Tax=Rhizophagus irregularis TaxID=588596 RepID=UPI00331BEFC7|nr:hypothetical protein OCT59_022906 [Rhizophagus irregularis]